MFVLNYIAQTKRNVVAAIVSTWQAGPVPCWTEYLREDQDKA